MTIFKALVALALFGLVSAAYAAPQAITLMTHNQRSSSGSLSTLVWKNCGSPGTAAPCYNYGNPWTLTNIDATGSTAAWTWDDATGVLAMTGLFITSSYISSNPVGTSVLGDRVTDLTINTTTSTTTATTYRCIEGTFLQGVGAHGCGNYSLGGDFVNNSSVDYMGPPGDPASPYVGPPNGIDPYCVTRTLAGDDVSTGDPRGLRTAAAYTGCDATAGAFNLYTVVQYSGGLLILSNGIATGSPNTNYLTFSVPVPAAVWLLGSALGLLGWVRRRSHAI
jgi:hypothetical protein